MRRHGLEPRRHSEVQIATMHTEARTGTTLTYLGTQWCYTDILRHGLEPHRHTKEWIDTMQTEARTGATLTYLGTHCTGTGTKAQTGTMY